MGPDPVRQYRNLLQHAQDAEDSGSTWLGAELLDKAARLLNAMTPEQQKLTGESQRLVA
jgi:hypothetical protein